MEALAALSLAGNTVQFIQFASELLKNSSELRKSSIGCTAKILDLDTLYRQLFHINTAIENGQRDASSYLSEPNAASLQTLSSLCKRDCEKLLETLGRLRSHQGSRWQTFRMALQLHLKKDEIKDMEDRLQKTQSAMTLQICSMARHELP